MNEPSTDQETILRKTLRILTRQHQLTPTEIVQVRLSHLHLAGKSPIIQFTPEGSQEPKTVALDLDTHRALVNWLVNRPDSVGDFLFPGKGAAPIEVSILEQIIEAAEVEPVEPQPAHQSGPMTLPEAEVTVPPPGGTASRPVRPLSRPETGTPPPGLEATAVSFNPPPSAPEADETMISPPPVFAPKPPPPTSRPPVAASRPVTLPAGPPEAASPAEIPTPPEPDKAAAEKAPAPVPGETGPSAAPGKKVPEEKTVTGAMRPAATGTSKTPTNPIKKEVKPGVPAMAASAIRSTAPQTLAPRPAWARFIFPGIVVLVVLLCAGCLGGGWLAAKSEPGSQLLALLGWSSEPGQPVEATSEAQAGDSGAVVFESVVPTPTLPPTSTPTALPPTHTPASTETATPTPGPTNTPTPKPTDTPAATDTPAPTETPETKEEENPAETPSSDTPSTSEMKYAAPELQEPAEGFSFIQGNTIVLRWKPVELAPDEQYAVRLVYLYQGQPAYQGTQVKEPEWTVPLPLFGKIDGPENRYEWFVVIERLNDDGSGTAISPESEHHHFTWK